MQLQSDICIIGTGAIGKVAALGLAQSGLRVCLLGPQAAAARAPIAPSADDWDVRVYAVNQVAHDLLASVKVWDALDATRVAPVEAMVVKGDAAANAASLDFDAYGAHVSQLAWIVEDRNLNQALDAALKFSSNVQRVSAQAVAMHADDQSVRVQLDNGDTLTAQLLVGADGGQSWVRNQADIGIDYRAYHQRAMVANFSCEKPHQNVAYQWFTKDEGIVALLPLPGQRVSLVWSAPEALANTLQHESLVQLAQRLSVIAAPQLGALQPLPAQQIKAFPLALIRAHALTAARVALVGDAAHVVHPLAGHGMNLGFADVAALLQTLRQREPHRDCGDARVLGRYARARKEEILLMQLATDGLARLFASDFEPLRVLRNSGLNFMNKLPVIKRRLISHALGKRL